MRSNLALKLDFEIKADVQKDIYRARKAEPKRDMAASSRRSPRSRRFP